MSVEQKTWLIGTIVLFVLFVIVGWFLTVGQHLQNSFKQSRAVLSGSFMQTKQTVTESVKIKEKAQVVEQDLTKMIETYAQNLEAKKKLEEETLNRMKEQLKQTSTP